MKFNIDDLLKFAVKNEASDIHISVGVPPILRINGQLIKINDIERLMPDDTKELAENIIPGHLKEKFKALGEIDFSYSVVGVGRFRVNVYNQRGSCSMALRSVPLNIPTIEDLKLPSVIHSLAEKKRGLILVTGPTGSGKSTTLAAMIDYINSTRSAHILTLEDPIEYLHRHNKSIVNQREIGHDSMSYANALRASLRQDPDVILIGEMRDLETMSIAITAAETGHLVLSTLHTTGAVATVDRIIDVFPPNQQEQIRVQLASVLQGVISQQLIKRADNTGRIAALEVMICNAAIKNHIREGKAHQILSSIQTGKKVGMVTMDSSIGNLYKEKIITYEDAMAYAIDKDFLSRLI